MRTTGSEILNAIAWALALVLVAVTIVFADVLGFVGVFILGLFTWLICTHMELDDDTPTSAIAVFRARMSPERSEERRAAVQAERQVRLSPVPFYRWCGIALTVIGAVGFVVQQWMAG